MRGISLIDFSSVIDTEGRVILTWTVSPASPTLLPQMSYPQKRGLTSPAQQAEQPAAGRVQNPGHSCSLPQTVPLPCKPWQLGSCTADLMVCWPLVADLCNSGPCCCLLVSSPFGIQPGDLSALLSFAPLSLQAGSPILMRSLLLLQILTKKITNWLCGQHSAWTIAVAEEICT